MAMVVRLLDLVLVAQIFQPRAQRGVGHQGTAGMARIDGAFVAVQRDGIVFVQGLVADLHGARCVMDLQRRAAHKAGFAHLPCNHCGVRCAGSSRGEQALRTLHGGDVLQSASSPVAGVVELHTHLHDNGVMRMRQVPEIVIPAQQKVALQPGGLHIMLIDLKAPLKVGDTVPLTLRFETAGSVQLDVPVKAVTAMPMQEMSNRH